MKRGKGCASSQVANDFDFEFFYNMLEEEPFTAMHRYNIDPHEMVDYALLSDRNRVLRAQRLFNEYLRRAVHVQQINDVRPPELIPRRVHPTGRGIKRKPRKKVTK